MKNGHSRLTAAERRKAVDRAERVKYNKTHPKKAARKGNRRKGARPGARLAYD
tara:strand:- start:203 stop:361 length:159 start_codon:yes stop_codon:yes gene_type:complete